MDQSQIMSGATSDPSTSLPLPNNVQHSEGIWRRFQKLLVREAGVALFEGFWINASMGLILQLARCFGKLLASFSVD